MSSNIHQRLFLHPLLHSNIRNLARLRPTPVQACDFERGAPTEGRVRDILRLVTAAERGTDLSQTGTGSASGAGKVGAKVTVEPVGSRMITDVPSVFTERFNCGGQSSHFRETSLCAAADVRVAAGSAPSAFSWGSSGGLNVMVPFL